MMTETAAPNESLNRAFDALRADGGGKERSWLAPLRQKAFDRFSGLGFPTTKDENWKYTNVTPIAKAAFSAPAPGTAGLTTGATDALAFGPTGGARLVFVNGRYAPSLSREALLPKGSVVKSLFEAFATDRARVEENLARYAELDSRPFTALNTALMSDGLYVDLPDGAIVEAPIHAVFITAPDGSPSMTHPRSLILAGAGSQATVLESYSGASAGVYLTNAVTEIRAGMGAALRHYRIQRESAGAFHIGRVHAEILRDAAFVSHAVTLGASLTRNEIDAVLAGEGADCTLNGLYVLGGSQHADNHTTIDHALPHGTSREVYKGVLDGRSRGVFDGKIMVRPGAQKTNARQTNRNLLLSEQALADTKPQLEIFADDVKCTHAATVGQLDRDAIFYLRSRGLDLAAARNLMTHAFVSELLAAVTIEPLRAGLDAMMHDRLDPATGGGSAS